VQAFSTRSGIDPLNQGIELSFDQKKMFFTSRLLLDAEIGNEFAITGQTGTPRDV
jgi:hypothetical protein